MRPSQTEVQFDGAARQRRCTQARELVEQAQSAMVSRRLDTSLELATQALEIARDGGDTVACGRSLALIASVQVTRGQAEAAYASACSACGLLEGAADAAWLQRAQNARAHVHMQSGEYQIAVEIWRHALKATQAESADTALTTAFMRAMMTYNVAAVLLAHEDYEQAIDLLSPGLAHVARAPDPAVNHLRLASALAIVHAKHAEVLSRAGDLDGSRTQLRCAAHVLPTLDPASWRSFSIIEANALWSRVQVLSALGEFAQARRAAAAAFAIARQSPRSAVNSAAAAAAVAAAELHRHSGHLQRALHFHRRALTQFRALKDEHAVVQVMRMLAAVHTDRGEYAQALALRKEMMVMLAADRAQRSVMSRRLAVIEREVLAQLADAQEKVAHAKQLALVGRLVGQIHHALLAPIQRTRELCLLALRAHARAATEGLPAPGLPALLLAISGSIDEAASLSRQMKIYAYRSSAITTTLCIADALREVWSTLRPHLSDRARELRVSGDANLHVRADAQRLGVLLTLMMIELVKKQAALSEVAVVTAVLDKPEPGRVALVMDAELCPEALHADPASMALIETLCEAIAAEMGATLSCTQPGGPLLRCILVMPDADTQ